MRATRKIEVSTVSEVERAAARLEDVRLAHERATATVTDLRKAVIAAEERFETCPDAEAEDAREALAAARLELKKFEEEHTSDDLRRMESQIRLAEKRHAAAVEAEKRARLEELKPKLSAFSERLEGIIVRGVGICTAAERLAGETIEATHAHASVYAEAKALCLDLGLPIVDLGPEGDPDEIALVIRKSVAVANEADGAAHRWDAIVNYLSPPASDRSAHEEADFERTVDRNRRIAHERQLAQAHAAGIAAGKQSKETN
jgi:hypothetical protein